MCDVLELKVAFQHLFGRFPNAQLPQILQIGNALEKQDALNQGIRMFHLINRLVVFVLCELSESPILEHF